MLSWSWAGFWGAKGMVRGKPWMRLVERMLHRSMPAAEGLTVEKPPHDHPVCPQLPALQRRGSAAPLAAAAPAQQHQGAVKGEDQAVPDASEVAGTWGDDEDVGMGMALVWGSVLLLSTPENRQSSAGPQQVDPAVPEPGEESIRGSR